MTGPLHTEGGSGMRRSYEEKHRLLVDLAMLFFGGVIRILLKRHGDQQTK